MSTDIESLYQSVIIEHDRSPRNFRTLADATHRANGRNPLCGDEVSVELSLDAEQRIVDIAFQGSGCAVSRASASMMTTALRGHTVAEAGTLFDAFHGMLTGAPSDPARLGKLTVFKGIGAFPMRVKCATLAWHAMKAALAHKQSEP
jgi:nitrogen fixation NifU-like protein